MYGTPFLTFQLTRAMFDIFASVIEGCIVSSQGESVAGHLNHIFRTSLVTTCLDYEYANPEAEKY